MARKRSLPLIRMIGQNVRRVRLAHGWSQELLAERIGLEPLSVSRIETGRTAPSISALADLADALEVPLARLVDVRREASAQGSMVHLVAIGEEMTVAEREIAIAVVQALLTSLRARTG